MKYSLPKGTFDILPHESKRQDQWKESHRWHYLESVIRELAHTYGYQEIRTPIFEKTELFIRGVGETSDIVSKEMYTFPDKGDRSMSLRPEGTASVMRAFTQNSLQQLGSNHKFFYIGPFFRYDRPQAGRFRQFHQFGVEAIGNGEPDQDFEAVELLYELFCRLGLKNLNVLVNSLGDQQCRKRYQKALLEFLEPYFDVLSPESQTRFTKNPLRILDSKDETECALLKNAPSILDFLSDESQKHFDSLREHLTSHGIPFQITPQLVRGLDYYNHTVFEITSDILGAQNTIGAGGRYDGLLPAVGGPDLPCIGFSVGIERILQTMAGQNIPFPEKPSPVVSFIPLGNKAKKIARALLYKLRHHNVSSVLIETRKIQRGLQQAEQINTSYSVVIGDKELKENMGQVKTMKTRETEKLPLNTIVKYFKEKNEL
ncbi:MAG: histidine--tRNA ligase [Candidatus Neptunochlamydia sp.]|nr:histidine--tRNA ligase [Candidatus Neptunochlamydia sp.]